jgi:ketosteroid isomerase-like protein
MSRENVELVRRSIETYIAGDRDAYLEFVAEDVEIRPGCEPFPRGRAVSRPRGVQTLPRRGRPGLGGWRHCSDREIFPVGDRVVARADWGGKGSASGIELRSSLTSLYTVQDGQITKIEFFFDHAEALEALGLRE